MVYVVGRAGPEMGGEAGYSSPRSQVPALDRAAVGSAFDREFICGRMCGQSPDEMRSQTGAYRR